MILSASLVCLAATSASQISKSDRDTAEHMLRDVAADVKKYYYDPKLHGLDWDSKVAETRQNIDKADSMDSAVSEIAALLDSLNDSHTVFILPPRSYVYKRGFRMKIIGDRCLITYVQPGSDAEMKDLRLGDQVLAINEVAVTRKSLPRIRYIFFKLRPHASIRLTLAGGTGEKRQVDVVAKVEPAPIVHYRLNQGINFEVRDWNDEYTLLEPQYFAKGDDFLAVRIPAFELSPEAVDWVLGRMRKHKGVVLDLRGNPGGFTKTLDRLVGGLFENDLKIYDRIGRDSTTTVSVKGRHQDAFTGRFVVLVDNSSASASELLARIVQLQKRGFVMGDRTAGAVMEARIYRHEMLVDTDVYYGAEISAFDLLMSDGKSLEHIGVEPDIFLLPTPPDIAAHRDPVMAKAAGLVGTKITPDEAGSMFPEKEAKH
ncbi:MAG: S41 family peptidase [Terriglobales bacterium]